MFSMILGLTAFGLFLLYDINSFTRQYRIVHSFFSVGTLLLGIATGMDLWHAMKRMVCFLPPDMPSARRSMCILPRE